MTNDMYDALAPHYREYSEKKNAYLKAIDELVISNIPTQAASLLDVGAGDGIRGMSIALNKGIKNVVLCDSSTEMVKKCKELNPKDTWQINAEDIKTENGQKFDVVLCLWNVLGHINSRENRIKALSKIKNLLTENGILFFDVNNRHNAVSYGWFSVFKRIISDFIKPDDKKGDTSFSWKIGDKVFPGKGHLFTPKEIKFLVKQSGLKIKRRLAVNYTNGKISNCVLKGQLFFIITK